MNEEQRAFIAGWCASSRSEDHEWGPAPPATPTEAFILWKNTCGKGHYTFKCRPEDANTCGQCRILLKRGEYK